MFQILTGGIQDKMLGTLTSEDIKEACASFPKLQAALFPSELSCGMIEQDITVYNLLQVSMCSTAAQSSQTYWLPHN
jgi:hypothetical protein